MYLRICISWVEKNNIFMQKLFLIFHGRFPSEKAAALFAAKSCEAFAEGGTEVVLLVPRRLGRVKEDSFVYYNLKKNFTIKFLPTLDLFFIPFFERGAFYISLFVFSKVCALYLMVKSAPKDIIYSNEHLPLFLVSFFRKNTFYEVHDMPRGWLYFYKKLLERVRGVVVTNMWKRDNIVRIFGISKEKMLYEMNAVDIKEFNIPTTQEEARVELKVPTKGLVVLYTGHLYSWKGAHTLAEAAKLLPDDVTVYFVGGTEKDVASFRERFGGVANIVIVGHRNHTEMPLWQKAADVVVVPNTAKEDISKYDTSPMKIFEYMASKKTIIATDIPSIREILNNTNAIIVLPDDPETMAKGIMQALQNKEGVQKITDQAYHDVAHHTWRERSKRVLKFLEALKI